MPKKSSAYTIAVSPASVPVGGYVTLGGIAPVNSNVVVSDPVGEQFYLASGAFSIKAGPLAWAGPCTASVRDVTHPSNPVTVASVSFTVTP